ncbi:MAG: hypothetical protein AVO35_11295 [Candidatus Aegiribacteria sp. MLS_C]|nr:MAG: hypothetical protein AVO35_11295 [Candidatus Aegiribacteria sp. MLS_C]
MKLLVFFLLAASVAVCTADPVVDRTLDAPAGDITGLGLGGGYLRALDRTSETVYRMDPVTGAVSLSWAVTQTGTRIPTGLTFLNDCVFVAAGTATGTAACAYRYSSSGSYVSCFSQDC